jgi:hypothetical protein
LNKHLVWKVGIRSSPDSARIGYFTNKPRLVNAMTLILSCVLKAKCVTASVTDLKVTGCDNE